MAAVTSRRTQVSVIGSGGCQQDSEPARLAEEVGRRLAEAGATVVCGGRGGVMEAASRGAAEAGGAVIGILPWVSPDEANPHCTQVVATGTGQARNLAVVASGEVAIAIGGEWGTLSEIGHARSIGRTVVALRSWTLKGNGAMESAPGVIVATTPEEAVAVALGAIAA
ncbi:MAG TPA: TIGR00725 family protein [Solirubrobacterales bacterium]